MMEAAAKVYHAKVAPKFLEDEINLMLASVDREIVSSLREEGFGSKAVLTALFNFSPLAKNIRDDELFASYKSRVLPADFSGTKNEAVPAALFSSLRVRHSVSVMQSFFLEADVSALSELLDRGYSPRDLQEAYMHHSLFAEYIPEAEAHNIYESRVFEALRANRENAVEREIVAAREEYGKALDQVQGKYAGNAETDSFAVVIEGGVLLHLIVESGFLPETAKLVLMEKSKRANADRGEYAQKILEECAHIKYAYGEIADAPASMDGVQSPEDVYRFFARAYMTRNGLKILDYESDLAILQEMRELEFPEEFLRETFLAASPVAMEPGRNPQRYVDGLMEERALSKDAFLSSKTYISPEDSYRIIAERMNDELIDRGEPDGIQKYRSYYDTLIVREMLLSHIPDDAVFKALSRFSVKAQETAGMAEAYGRFIIDKAHRILAAEESFLSFRRIGEIPEGSSYADLCVRFSPLELFQSALVEHLRLNPSIRRRLFEDHVIADITETCFARCPDFNREAMLGILRMTPAAILLDGSHRPKDYAFAENTIREAERRLAGDDPAKRQEDSILAEFNRQCGLAAQGVNVSVSAMSAYQYGQSALKMLMAGYDKNGIRSCIEKVVQPKDMTPEKFADTIMDSTQEVYTRIQNAKSVDFSSPEPETAGQDYQRRLASLMEGNAYPKGRMDIEIYKSMLAEKRWAAAKLEAAIQELSPLAAQAGRNKNYIQYVRERAKALLLEERSRLERYKAELRAERDKNAEEAYRYYQAQLREQFTLPYVPRMDEHIMLAMLAEGFLAAEIIPVVDSLSPLKDGQSNYGLSLLRHLEAGESGKSFGRETESTQETERGSELVPQRVLTLPPETGTAETGATG